MLRNKRWQQETQAQLDFFSQRIKDFILSADEHNCRILAYGTHHVDIDSATGKVHEKLIHIRFAIERDDYIDEGE